MGTKSSKYFATKADAVLLMGPQMVGFGGTRKSPRAPGFCSGLSGGGVSRSVARRANMDKLERGEVANAEGETKIVARNEHKFAPFRSTFSSGPDKLFSESLMDAAKEEGGTYMAEREGEGALRREREEAKGKDESDDGVDEEE